MSELTVDVVFQNFSPTFTGGALSAMYFGRHYEKNILILNHDLSVLMVFGDEIRWSSPEFIKAVSFRGDRRKGIRIVGNEDVILQLDDRGCLWRLINAFEVTAEKNECFHSLEENCFYEWVPFKNFNFVKVLAITALEYGFACLGVCGNFERKLVMLPSVDSPLEEYDIEELIRPEKNSFSYYLTNLKMQSSVLDITQEALLVTDRISGRTYVCTKNGKNLLLNVSDNNLISALCFEQEKGVLLCFNNGKLIFHFLNNKSQRQAVAYLSEEVVFIDKCCCTDLCLLWSNGMSLNHTKLKFNCSEDIVILSHLKLNCCIQSPIAMIKIHLQALVVTINNVYYCIGTGTASGREMRKRPQELLSEICRGSSLCGKLEEKIDLLAYYLQCKDIIQKGDTREKTEIKWEGNCLAVKNHLGVSLREGLWKVQLVSFEGGKKSVHVTDLPSDFNKGATILIKNPFRGNGKIKINLIGDFDENDLFLDLGEIDEVVEGNSERDQLKKQILNILSSRNKFHMK